LCLGVFSVVTLIGSTDSHRIWAYQPPAETPATETTPVEPAPAATSTAPAKDLSTQANDALESAKKQTDELARKVDESADAKKYSAGILEPIYGMAEYMSFSYFHWVAFMLMVSGVVSYALQLVLGKFVVLLHSGFSLGEIISDAQGLLISLVGLFLTTQAATENSSFTSSPFSVLSAAGVGAVVGFILYLWGQAQEVQAAKGRDLQNIQKV
jgi:hypothetical protein